jgi:aspartyl-tRNA(Asn)/glutamyl-tRNA(Gln) amidotransferase subunit A
MTAPIDGLSALEIALAVKGRKMSAVSVTEAALARIAKYDSVLNCFTDVTADRARMKARAIDAAISAGQNAGPLAGVPFAVKNLFDVRGLSTRAGSKINRERAPSPRDATLIERMEAAGAVLVGALNMGEYAYDFTGENVHDGASRNPHDLTRMTGGSSGGSGGAVGGGLVPLALGSDTNGSIRVPSSFCGIFGLKPTYGRLSRARTFPFVFSLDHLGPFAPTSVISRWFMMRCRVLIRTMRRARPGPPSRSRRCSQRVSGICGLRSPADIFRTIFCRKRSRPLVASPARSAPPG